jgi:hypothetical protein
MTTTGFDTRINQLETRLDKAESFLDAGGRVLEAIEHAHESAGRARRNPIVLMAGSLLVAVTVALVARRQLSR